MFKAIITWLFGCPHENVAIDCEFGTGCAYFCLDCREWLDPNVKRDWKETYDEAMAREERDAHYE